MKRKCLPTSPYYSRTINTMRYSCVLNSAIGLIAFAGLSSSCSAENMPVKFQVLEMHGQTYYSACTADQLSNLGAAFLKERSVKSDQIWRAVNVMLCTPKGAASRRFVKALLPTKVRQLIESTGDEPSTKFTVRTDAMVDEMFAEGKAWDARITSDGETVTLLYFSNEACVASRTLQWKNKKLAIVEIGEACD